VVVGMSASVDVDTIDMRPSVSSRAHGINGSPRRIYQNGSAIIRNSENSTVYFLPRPPSFFCMAALTPRAYCQKLLCTAVAEVSETQALCACRLASGQGN
jgi:hypothetical protein